jgi:isohexenylglutaconyl-CoA hydratase
MRSETKTDTLILSREASWMTVRFNQAQIKNALTREMTADLNAVIADLESDRTVRGVTFRGEGQTFCAGGDLKAFHEIFQGSASQDTIAAFSRDAGDFMRRLDALPQVTVMLVEGACMAGGFGLACCGDLVLAHQDARFSLTETRIGLVPAQIIPYIVHRMGRRNARRFMLTAASVDGAEAARVGLADFVAPDTEALEALEKQVRAQVLRCAPGAVADTKALLRSSARDTPDEYIARAADVFASRMLGEEAREGIASFVERRKPAWSE